MRAPPFVTYALGYHIYFGIRWRPSYPGIWIEGFPYLPNAGFTASLHSCLMGHAVCQRKAINPRPLPTTPLAPAERCPTQQQQQQCFKVFVSDWPIYQDVCPSKFRLLSRLRSKSFRGTWTVRAIHTGLLKTSRLIYTANCSYHWCWRSSIFTAQGTTE